METEIVDYMKYPYPNQPGVYLMKDNKHNVIYIGKAKNLNKRIRSYFTSKTVGEERSKWKN